MGGGITKKVKELEKEIIRLRGSTIIKKHSECELDCYAIYIACDKYMYFPNLKSCVQDAQNLEKKTGYKTLAVLYNEQVTLQNILKTFTLHTTSNSKIIIFFAGHGHYIPQCNRSFFVCHNSKEIDLIYTGIDLNNIQSYCDYLNAEHQLYILDCCYSGCALRYRSTHLMNSPSIFIMSAGRSMQTVAETDKYGIFTNAIIQHWKKNITITQLFYKVRSSIQKQIPMLGRIPKYRDKHAEGEFVT